jgi:hypothetical protein
VADQESYRSDPFCGGCGAPAGQPHEEGCGAREFDPGEKEGATLLLALHIPGYVADDDPDMAADCLVGIINEERRHNGGGRSDDVTVSVFPACEWMTADTMERLRAAADSPPPTPGPTREQVADAAAALVGRAGSSRPTFVTGVVAMHDAVVALLPASALTVRVWGGRAEELFDPLALGLEPGTHVVVTRRDPDRCACAGPVETSATGSGQRCVRCGLILGGDDG